MPTIEDNLDNPSEEELDEVEIAAKDQEKTLEKAQKIMPESGASVKTLWKLLKNPLKKSRQPNKIERHQKQL